MSLDEVVTNITQGDAVYVKTDSGLKWRITGIRELKGKLQFRPAFSGRWENANLFGVTLDSIIVEIRK